MQASSFHAVAPPSFDYWIVEAKKILKPRSSDYAGALFCASKAVEAATSDIEWAEAKNLDGIFQFHLGKLDFAMSAFTMKPYTAASGEINIL